MSLPSDRTYDLDIFGRHMRPLYTQLCLCFSMDDTVSSEAVVQTLEHGLDVLSQRFPWAMGHVVNTSVIDSSKSRAPVAVKDLRNDPLAPSMDELRQADFPMQMLDEDMLCPLATRPAESDRYPVFLLQATFIQGGLLLAFLGQHQAMDMTGQGQMMYLLNKACHDQAYTHDELIYGNVARRNIIPCFDALWQPASEQAQSHNHPQMPPASLKQENRQPSPQLWANFAFAASDLQSLKSLAMQAVDTESFVSTDDALTAFVWQSITRSRLPRLTSSTSTSLTRNVDMRLSLNVTPTYPGLVVRSTWHTHPAVELVQQSLGTVALELRKQKESPRLAYETRAAATALYRGLAENAIFSQRKLDLSVDLRLSSWAKEQIYAFEFNLGLGKPGSVRRPWFYPAEGLVYILPKKLDGEIVVALCLRDDDMAKLRTDQEWTKCARWIG